MKKLTTFFGRGIILACFIISTSYANNKISDTQIYQLLDKSGVTKTVEGLPLQIQAMGQQMALTAKDPVEHQKFMQVLTSSLNSDAMLQKMIEHIQNNISLEEFNNIINWLDSDLAIRLVKAELQSSDPSFQQNLMSYMAELQATPPSSERTSAVIHYVESSELVEQTMNMLMVMMENMFTAIKATQPENEQLDTQLDAQLEQMSVTMAPSIEQQMILSSYFIYRDISNEDLATYSKFYSQATGQKYLSLLVGAFSYGMSDWGVNLVNQITKDDN